MGIVAWTLLGLAVGVTAQALDRGAHQPAGARGTLVLALAGAVLGGFVALALGVGSIGSFLNVGAWLIAIAGALLAIAVYNVVIERREGQRSA
jgi:uncharacterized membrane protein YeaQ/YmgE (transglycosylase-associated protein family)